jgi:hypothetical protein
MREFARGTRRVEAGDAIVLSSSSIHWVTADGPATCVRACAGVLTETLSATTETLSATTRKRRTRFI